MREKLKLNITWKDTLEMIWFETDFWKLNPKYIFIRNPCKKCIVNTMCSEICSKKHTYIQYIEFWRYGGMTWQARLTTFILDLCLVIIPIALIYRSVVGGE